MGEHHHDVLAIVAMVLSSGCLVTILADLIWHSMRSGE